MSRAIEMNEQQLAEWQAETIRVQNNIDRLESEIHKLSRELSDLKAKRIELIERKWG